VEFLMTGFEDDIPVAQLKHEAPLETQEDLVLGLVAVPLKRALATGEFQVLAVGLPDDARAPCFVEGLELGLQIDCVCHGLGVGGWPDCGEH